MTEHTNAPVPATDCSGRLIGAPGVVGGTVVVVIVSGIATWGAVLPVATSSLFTDCATAAGVTAPEAS